jgi:hypothetical protein
MHCLGREEWPQASRAVESDSLQLMFSRDYRELARFQPSQFSCNRVQSDTLLADGGNKMKTVWTEIDK